MHLIHKFSTFHVVNILSKANKWKKELSYLHSPLEDFFLNKRAGRKPRKGDKLLFRLKTGSENLILKSLKINIFF